MFWTVYKKTLADAGWGKQLRGKRDTTTENIWTQEKLFAKPARYAVRLIPWAKKRIILVWGEGVGKTLECVGESKMIAKSVWG